jgi:hypothetical protein
VEERPAELPRHHGRRLPEHADGDGPTCRARQFPARRRVQLIRFARDRGLTRIEAPAAGSVAWTDHVIEASKGLLFTEVDSWMTGINRNVEGSRIRQIMRYSGGHPKFRERCEAVAANGYREMALA